MPGLWGSELSTDWIFSFIGLSGSYGLIGMVRYIFFIILLPKESVDVCSLRHGSNQCDTLQKPCGYERAWRAIRIEFVAVQIVTFL